jgi:hypothetical protein
VEGAMAKVIDKYSLLEIGYNILSSGPTSIAMTNEAYAEACMSWLIELRDGKNYFLGLPVTIDDSVAYVEGR